MNLYIAKSLIIRTTIENNIYKSLVKFYEAMPANWLVKIPK